MTVGERIKKLRIKAGFSQVDFANKINVTKQTLYKYENNIITNIPSDKVEAAARVVNVSPAYLMGWKDESEMHQAELSLQDQQAYAIDTLYSAFGNREVEHFKSYIKLAPSYARKVDSYTEKLLSMQKMENEVELAAAHERTDIEVTEEDRLKDDAIMRNDAEWK